MSHILAGRLHAFHEVKGTPGLFIAEVAVSSVEKGAGVSPGDLIYVRFTSPRTLDRIRAERVVSSCGDRKIDPLPGEWMRIYTRLDEGFAYVADYPDCFFEVSQKDPAVAPRSPSLSISRRTALAISAVFLTGFLAGFGLRVRSRSLPTSPGRNRT